MFRRVPLHRRACVVTTVEVNEAECLCGGKSFLERKLVLSVGGDVVVCVDRVPLDVCHAELFALVDEGRAAQSHEDGRECFCGKACIAALREEVVDGACAVMVLEVDRVPALLGNARLTC